MRTATIGLSSLVVVLATPSHSVGRVASMHVARSVHTTTTLASGEVLIVGGMAGGGALASAELYDPARNTTAVAGLHSTGRSGRTSTRLADGRVVIAGGYCAPHIDILDANGRAFREVAGALPEGYQFAASALLVNGDVMIAGGYSGAVSATDGIWRFKRR